MYFLIILSVQSFNVWNVRVFLFLHHAWPSLYWQQKESLNISELARHDCNNIRKSMHSVDNTMNNIKNGRVSVFMFPLTIDLYYGQLR